MASVVLTAVGSALGASYMGLFGRVLFGVAGAVGGSLIDNMLFGSNSKTSSGKLDSLKVSDASYGDGIAKLYGQVRTAGNIIWSSDLIETVTSTTTSTSGGKGGGSSVTTETYTYRVNVAIALGENEIGGISRIWADGDLVYNYGWNSGLVSGSFNVYNGTSTQTQDPVMVAALGSTNTPAYRGIAYVVIEGLQLADFGNRIPNLEFEVIPKTTTAVAPKIYDRIETSIYDGRLNAPYLTPIVLGSGASSGRTILVGGYIPIDSTHIAFQISEYDVSGNTPILGHTATSDNITTASYSTTDTSYGIYFNLGATGWARSPDGRYVAIAVGDILNEGGSTGTHTAIAIYDTINKVFGSVYTYLTNNYFRGAINWVDTQHIFTAEFYTNQYSTSYGYGRFPAVRVFAREGLNVSDKGLFTVVPHTDNTYINIGYDAYGGNHNLFYFNGGLLLFTVDQSGYNSGYYYIYYLQWSDGTVKVSNRYTWAKASIGSSGGAGFQMIQYSGNEYIGLLDNYVIELWLNSFTLSFDDTTNSLTITTTRSWQQVYDYEIGVCNNRSTVLTGGQIVSLADPAYDNYYYIFTYDIGSSSFTLNNYVEVSNDYAYYRTYSLTALSPTKLMTNSTKATNWNDNVALQLFSRFANYSSQYLAYIVADLLEAAGYSSSDYDVTALADTFIQGFIVSDPTSARESISTLRSYALFDLVENDDILKAIIYDDTIVATVELAEMRAALEDEDQPDPIEFTRTKESDLPYEVDIDYNDADNDYETDTQVARRDVSTNAYSTTKVQLPVSMSADTARQLAEKTLFAAWAERTKGSLTVGPKYLDITPGDVITFNGTTLRVSKVTNKGMILEIEGNSIIGSVFTSEATGATGTGSGGTGTKSSYLTLYVMNLPAMLEAHDTPGIFITSSYSGSWKGCSVYRSSDNEYYSLYTSVTKPSAAGVTTNALADGPDNYIDRASTVRVSLDSGELESIEFAALIDGANLAMVGDEIIQFETATLISTGAYELTNLLRGRFGTDWAIDSHTSGERFVLLSTSTIQFISAQLTDQGRSYYYKAAYLGQDLDNVIAESDEVVFNNLKPLSPVRISGSRTSGTGSDLVIDWVRRARINGGWTDSIDVPLDESTESYEIDIMDGTTVLRTLTSSTTTVTYTAAEQTSDWTTVPDTVEVNVYQISSRVGRGYAGNATI